MVDFSDIDIEETKYLLTDEEFVKFLIENRAYDKFINNLRYEILSDSTVEFYYYSKCWFSIDSFCDDIRTKYGRQSYIGYAFVWSDTEEGRDFWKKIHYLWEKLC